MSRTPRSPVPAPLHLEAFQLKPSRASPVWERRSVRSSHTHPPFWWRVEDARDRILIGRGVLTTLPIGPFCRVAGAQSVTQPWHTDPSSPIYWKFGYNFNCWCLQSNLIQNFNLIENLVTILNAETAEHTTHSSDDIRHKLCVGYQEDAVCSWMHLRVNINGKR